MEALSVIERRCDKELARKIKSLEQLYKTSSDEEQSDSGDDLERQHAVKIWQTRKVKNTVQNLNHSENEKELHACRLHNYFIGIGCLYAYMHVCVRVCVCVCDYVCVWWCTLFLQLVQLLQITMKQERQAEFVQP